MARRVAALYDVHGNLPALEAVLREVALAEPDAIVFGGDLVWGPWPREVLLRVRENSIETHFIRGNTDRLALTSPEASFAWTRERLSTEERRFVGSWPETVTLDVIGLGETLFCHATPRSDAEVVLPGLDASEWAESAAGVSAVTIVCGHTHLQFEEHRGGRRWINPGSVGNPTVRSAAWWAVLGPSVELHATEYDTDRTAEAMRATGFPRTDFADELLEPYTRERLLTELGSHG